MNNSIINSDNTYIEICEMSEEDVAGRAKIRMSSHFIHPEAGQWNKNGITWLEEYTQDNIKSAIGMNYVVSWADEENQIPSGHGEMSFDEDGNVKFEGVVVGSVLDAYICDVEIDGQIKEELLKDSYKNSDRSVDWWYERLVASKPIWEAIDKWVYDNYNQNSHKVKTQYQMLNSGWPPDLQHKIENLERAKRDEFTECVSELVSLGVLRLRVTGGTIGSGSGSEYSFTSFGRKFLKISFNQ